MRKKELFFMMLVGAVVFFAFSCSTTEQLFTEKTSEKEGTATNLAIDGPSEVSVGETITLTASAYDENIESIKADPTWSVDDTDVAEIESEEGDKAVVKGLSTGMAFITAEQDGVETQTVVQVK